MFKRFLFVVFVLLISNSCIEPIALFLGDYNDLLVVDAQITNEKDSYKVTLFRTTSEIDYKAVAVEGAQVGIVDEKGMEYSFDEKSPGIYTSDSTLFTGEVGLSYELYIKTIDGKEYRSEPCLLKQPSIIDSVYFLPDEYWADFVEERQMGIAIYVDGRGVSQDSNYVRWTYHEDWKFQVPYPSNREIREDNTVWFFKEKNVYCWKSDLSRSILIHSTQNQVNQDIVAKKLFSIPTGESDKVSIRYSVLVKQHSISKKEYIYWKQLKETTEDIYDIFGKQLFPIQSNIKNINDPKEPILGYFKVSGVSTKRIYIDREEIEKLYLPIEYLYGSCPVKPFMLGASYLSAYEMYQKLILRGSYSIVNAIYNETGDYMIGLMLTPKECADCSLTGRINPPSFWNEY